MISWFISFLLAVTEYSFSIAADGGGNSFLEAFSSSVKPGLFFLPEDILQMIGGNYVLIDIGQKRQMGFVAVPLSMYKDSLYIQLPQHLVKTYPNEEANGLLAHVPTFL